MMQYRNFTKDKLKISCLGYGMMRLPLLDASESRSIDYKNSSKLLSYALKKGVNYIDTAYNYHGGESERFVGDFLKTIDRTQVYLTTKLPVWKATSHEDYRLFYNEQMNKLHCDYLDFYIAHSLDKNTFNSMIQYDVFSFFDELKKKRLVHYVGFSFHDDLNTFKRIVDYYPWDFCQIQLNYTDTEYQAGLAGLSYANKKGLDCIIMEPLKGGRLSKDVKELKNIFNGVSRFSFSLSQWALAYLLNMENIPFFLSGMNEKIQIDENCAVCDTIYPHTLTEEELRLFEKAKQFFDSKIKIDCTACEYCLPCPQNIAIPSIFSKYNNAFIFNEEDQQKKAYKNELINQHKDAASCISCGQCESKCPQHLNIIPLLQQVHQYMLSKKEEKEH